MGDVKLNSSGGGSVTLTTPSTASNYTVTLPAATSTLIDTTSTQTLTNKTLTAAGSNTVEATSGPTSTQLGGMRNKIINGAMMIDQRNAGASVTPGAGGTYTLDRWSFGLSQASKISVQQNAGSVTSPTGFNKYLGITSLSAYTASASEFFNFTQPIEGLNCADLSWGTASARTVTLSFLVYSSLTGTFGGSVCNSAVNRSYPFSYSISSANTWTTISITIPGDTSGTWLTTNGVGIYLIFDIGSGSNLKGTANAWAAGTYYGATGATSVVGTNGATFYITGVQLEKGSVATPFEYRQYGTELALCQRYFVSYGAGSSDSGSSTFAGYWAETTIVQASAATPVPMRSSPTITLLNPTTAMSVYRPGTSQAAPGAGASATEITQTGFILNSGICSSSSTQGFGTHWRCYGSGKVIASAEL